MTKLNKNAKKVNFGYRLSLAGYRWRWWSRGLTIAMVFGLCALALLPKNDLQQVSVAANYCNQLNAFHEARGESEAGQIAVLLVTETRAAKGWRGASDNCEAVFDPMQFSWANGFTADGNVGSAFIDAVIHTDLKVSQKPAEQVAWVKLEAIALEVATGSDRVADLRDYLAGADHYLTQAAYDAASAQHWAKHKQMTFVAKIGAHRFYRWDG